MFYEDFADSYDEMIDWASRLEYEKKKFEKLFRQFGVKKVLDAACGTGMHCIMFSKMGFKVVGADNSPAMLQQARINAKERGEKGIRFVLADFINLTAVVKGRFDAVVCLGNSLPHLVEDQDIIKALKEFHTLLRPEGLLVLQIVHFDHYLDSSESAVAVTDGMRDGRLVTFRRHYEFKGTKVIFHVSVYDRESRELLETFSSPLNAIRRELLETFIEKVGFANIQFYHDLGLKPLTTEDKSLIALAVRPRD